MTVKASEAPTMKRMTKDFRLCFDSAKKAAEHFHDINQHDRDRFMWGMAASAAMVLSWLTDEFDQNCRESRDWMDVAHEIQMTVMGDGWWEETADL
jgi:hypothetical protein